MPQQPSTAPSEAAEPAASALPERILQHEERMERLAQWFDLAPKEVADVGMGWHAALAAQKLVPQYLADACAAAIAQGPKFVLQQWYPFRQPFPKPAATMFEMDKYQALVAALEEGMQQAENTEAVETLAVAALQYAVVHISPKATPVQFFHLLETRPGEQPMTGAKAVERAFAEAERAYIAWLREYLGYAELEIKGKIVLKYWLHYGIHRHWPLLKNMPPEAKHLLTTLAIRPGSSAAELADINELPKQQVLEMLAPWVEKKLLQMDDRHRFDIVMA